MGELEKGRKRKMDGEGGLGIRIQHENNIPVILPPVSIS
jgi:hypothetical protein